MTIGQRGEAEAGRDDGIRRATEHANDVHPAWADRAFDMLVQFIAETPSAHAGFTSEDVRSYATPRGLPAPPHLRAWGGVFRRAAKSGLLIKSGTTQALSANVHCAVINVWRVAGVRDG